MLSLRHYNRMYHDFLLLIVLCATVGFLTEAFVTSSSLVASRPGQGRCCQVPLYSSRRPQRESRYEDEEEDYYNTRRPRERNREDQKIRNDVYYPDDEKPNGSKLQRFQYGDSSSESDDREDFDDDEDYYDDYEDDEESPAGNYWSNPPKTMDPVARRPRKRNGAYEKRRNSDRTYDAPRNGRRRSRVSTGGPVMPAPVRDLYDQLFWYGYDPGESADVGDKTVFGGTKGKFNGLSYLTASEKGRPARNRNDFSNRNDDYRYYDDDDDDYYDEEDEEDIGPNGSTRSETTPRPAKPPNDVPFPLSEPKDRPSPGERRPQTRRQARGERKNGSNWASGQVSSWFTDEDEEDRDGRYDDDDYDDDYYDGRGRRRRRVKRQNAEWSPFNAIDAFFGLDRRDMKYKADMYDEKMGLRQRRRRTQRRPTSRDAPRRAGYAYPYEEDEDDESPLVADIDTTAEVVETEPASSKPTRNGSTENTRDQDTKRSSRSRDISWEQRALAVERVPPAGIPAWGPTGQLPVDARTKAIMDALDDIQVATRKLEAKQKKEALASEDVTILKVDAELQRRRLEDSRQGSRLAEERLRQINLDLEEAGRALRRSRTQVEMAREELEELKDRHWALLSFYDADQAEEKVAESLKELEQSEPAARLDDSTVPSVAKVDRGNEQSEQKS